MFYVEISLDMLMSLLSQYEMYLEMCIEWTFNNPLEAMGADI